MRYCHSRALHKASVVAAVFAALIPLVACVCQAQTAANRSLAAPVEASPRHEPAVDAPPLKEAPALVPAADPSATVSSAEEIPAAAEAQAVDAADEPVAAPASSDDRADRPLAPRPSPASSEQRPLGHGEGGSGGGFWALMRTLAALAVVLGLIYLMARLLKRWNTGGRAGAAGVVEVLSRTPLTHRHGVMLVRVASRVLVVGVGPESVAALSEIDDPQEVAGILGAIQSRRPDSLTNSFASALDEKQLDLELSEEAVERMNVDEDDASPLASSSSVTSATLDRLEALLGRVRGLGERDRGGRA